MDWNKPLLSVSPVSPPLSLSIYSRSLLVIHCLRSPPPPLCSWWVSINTSLPVFIFLSSAVFASLWSHVPICAFSLYIYFSFLQQSITTTRQLEGPITTKHSRPETTEWVDWLIWRFQSTLNPHLTSTAAGFKDALKSRSIGNIPF